MNKIIDEYFVANLIKQDDQLDCLAIVVSSWHYLNALATINSLKMQGLVKKAIVLAVRHGRSGFIVDTHLWEREAADLEKYYFCPKSLPPLQDVARYLRTRTGKNNKLYLLRAVYPSPELAASLWQAGICRNFVNVVIDEGLGYYLRNTKDWLLEGKKAEQSKLKFFERVFKEWLYKVYTQTALKRRKQLLYHTFFLKKGRTLTINDNCVNCLRAVLEEIAASYSQDNYVIYENKLIICTQVFHDLGQIRNNADMAIIQQICDEARKKHIGVVIKPHPRETDINKYLDLGVEVDKKQSVPLEVILAGTKRKPLAMIGITTTSLVSANVLWDINSFSIINLVGTENFVYDVRDDIDHFPRCFSKFAALPNSINDIFSHIK